MKNGNLEIGRLENNEHIFQSFTIRASRKRLRRLKEIAANNVGQCLSSDIDIKLLNFPPDIRFTGCFTMNARKKSRNLVLVFKYGF